MDNQYSVSVVSNCRIGANKRTAYYIGHFGYYIRNYFLFNKNIWKNPKINRRTCTAIRYRRYFLSLNDQKITDYWKENLFKIIIATFLDAVMSLDLP